MRDEDGMLLARMLREHAVWGDGVNMKGVLDGNWDGKESAESTDGPSEWRRVAGACASDTCWVRDA